MLHVVAECVVDVIHSAADGFAKAAASYHGVEADGNVVGRKFFKDELLAKLVLVGGFDKP